MANSYTQLYVHLIFAVKGGESLIPKQHKEALHQYITHIITDKNQRVVQVNSMPSHIHILVGITPDVAISDLVRDIKADSSEWINNNRWIVGRFEWQTGFAALSCAQSQLDTIVHYIKSQESHFSRRTFKKEYLEFLKRFDVPYHPQYALD